MVVFDEDKQNKRVSDLRKQEEEDLAQTLSSKYGIPYLDLTVTPINIDALRVVKESEARDAEIAPFNIINKQVSLGIISPNNLKTAAVIENLKNRGYITSQFMVSHQSLQKVWSRYKDLSYSLETKSGALDISNEEIHDLVKTVKNIGDIKKSIEEVIAQKKSYRISKILEIVLAGAIAINASDVHIEPEDSYVRRSEEHTSELQSQR